MASERMGNIYKQANRKSNFEIDGSMLGYKNLKEKYMELKQLSLGSGKKNSELLEKAQYRRHEN